jgi:hypothetical protein
MGIDLSEWILRIALPIPLGDKKGKKLTSIG